MPHTLQAAAPRIQVAARHAHLQVGELTTFYGAFCTHFAVENRAMSKDKAGPTRVRPE